MDNDVEWIDNRYVRYMYFFLGFVINQIVSPKHVSPFL
jgi:hypothetical protein